MYNEAKHIFKRVHKCLQFTKKKMRKKVNSLESEWEFPLDATMISLKIIMWHNRKMRIFQHYWNDWNTTKWLQVLNDKNSTIAVI